MNNLFKLTLAVCAAMLCGVLCAAGASFVEWNNQEPEQAETPVTSPRIFDGMFFSTDYVVEEYEYDDAYCLVYDDIDAGCDNEEICVDLQTYKLCLESIESGKPLIGSLRYNRELSIDGITVYSYEPEPEHEMAAASAQM